MARAGLMLNRAQMLKALPKHVAIAALCGAVAGPILYFLNQIELEGQWNLLMALPIGAIFVNAAMIPLAVPGRHWSFGFIGAMLMFLLLIAGMIIAPKFPFPHSAFPYYTSSKINSITYAAILTGGCLGLFYGLLCGHLSSMVLGLAVGSALGYFVGIESSSIIFYTVINRDYWHFDSPLHFAWQLGAAMALLHSGACLGAALGAGPANPQSKIQNPKSTDIPS